MPRIITVTTPDAADEHFAADEDRLALRAVKRLLRERKDFALTSEDVSVGEYKDGMKRLYDAIVAS